MFRRLTGTETEPGPFENRAPTASDFSPEAAKKARLNDTIQNKLTRYSLLAPASMTAAGLVIGFSAPLLVLIALSGGFCVLVWVWRYFLRADRFESQYFEQLKSITLQQTSQRRERLKQELTGQGRPDAAAQLDQFERKFNNLISILSEKLNPEELTFKRYYGITLEVYLSGMDNLNEVYLVLKSISEIDPSYISQRLHELRRQADITDDAREEIGSLEARLELQAKSLEEVGNLITKNEIALRQLDEAAVAIAKMDTGKAESEVGMESAMTDLQRVIERAQQVIEQEVQS